MLILDVLVCTHLALERREETSVNVLPTEIIKVYEMNENKEKNKNERETPNGSDIFTGMDNPRKILVERAELNKLTSANLYKLLQYKKVCNRSKFRKKPQRLNALVGIVSRDDLKSLGCSNITLQEEVSEPELKATRPPLVKRFSTKPHKGKRLEVPVGGIDVHKTTLVVSVADQNGIQDRRNFLNNEEGIEDLVQFFRYYKVTLAALESTAEYWLKAFWKCTNAGIRMLVANPLQTKTTQGKKTDREDADRIALAFRDGRLKPSVVCTPDQYSMRKLSRAAFKKTQQATSAANRLNAMYETFSAADWIKKLRESRRGVRIFYRTLQLTDQTKILEILTEEYQSGPHQIRSKFMLETRAVELTRFLTNMDVSPNNRPLFGQHLEDYVSYKRVATEFRLKLIKFGTDSGCFTDQFQKGLEFLITVPNVDINTALMILVEVVDINFFWSSKALARWSGLAPRVNQSGYRKRKSGHIYKGGNKWLRTAVWLAAENCYRHLKDSDEPIGSFIKRLFKERKKHYFVAITAGARKLINYIYHVLTQQRPFDEIFEMERADQLKKNQQRKLRKLQKILNNSTVPEILPLIANSLKRESYKLNKTENQLALEIASKLGVAPKSYIDDGLYYG